MPDPSSALIAFFALPVWTQSTLAVMIVAIVFMNSILAVAIRDRRNAFAKVEEMKVELADLNAKLSSETRWRLADERYRASVIQAPATKDIPHSNAGSTSPA